jgi:diaminopimelate epimerase
MTTALYKAHGLGNDYLVLEQGPQLDARLVRALCDRHRGPGADGVLEPLASDRAHSGVRIWNPDGSVAEKSGNGLRILAYWLRRERGAPDAFSIEVAGELVDCVVDGATVDLGMGRARFEAEAVPVDLPPPSTNHLRALVLPGGEELGVVAVSVGNPHCVIFRDEEDLDGLPWLRWGEAIETHPAFPNRTNVQVARVAGPGTIEVRVWERGAGPTLASGSSACAVAAAAVRTGRTAVGPVTIEMPGGELYVTVAEDWAIRLRGPVAPVGRFVADPQWTP